MGVAAWLRKALGWHAPPRQMSHEERCLILAEVRHTGINWPNPYGPGLEPDQAALDRIVEVHGRSLRPPLNVVPIKPLVDADVVERLELLLARAKAGQIQFIAYVAESNDGCFVTNWAGFAKRGALATASMIAQLEFEFRLAIAGKEEVPFDPLPPAS